MAEESGAEYLSPLLLFMLQPDLQLPNHHLTLPLSNGSASFVVSGHQRVDVGEDHIHNLHLLLVAVEFLLAVRSM